MKFIALVIIVEALRLQKYLMLKKDTTLLIGIQKIFDLKICFPNVIIICHQAFPFIEQQGKYVSIIMPFRDS